MNEIITKLNKIGDFITSENKLGKVILFALIARNDLVGKWDILISADGLKKNNTEKDLTYVIELLKKEFGNDLSFLSQIVLLVTKEDFVNDFVRAFRKGDFKVAENISLKLTDNFTIGSVYVISYDFSTLDLEVFEDQNKKGSRVSQLVGKF